MEWRDWDEARQEEECQGRKDFYKRISTHYLTFENVKGEVDTTASTLLAYESDVKEI